MCTHSRRGGRGFHLEWLTGRNKLQGWAGRGVRKQCVIMKVTDSLSSLSLSIVMMMMMVVLVVLVVSE